jgi:hypothetical protein
LQDRPAASFVIRIGAATGGDHFFCRNTSGSIIGCRVMPDLVTAGRLTVELKAQRFQSPGNVAVTKTSEPPIR